MNTWTQFLAGAASVVVILGALFALLNGWMIDKITSKVRECLDATLEKMKKEFARDADLRNMEHNVEREIKRLDNEFGHVWDEMNKRQRIHP